MFSFFNSETSVVGNARMRYSFSGSVRAQPTKLRKNLQSRPIFLSFVTLRSILPKFIEMKTRIKESENQEFWFVYILKCANEKIYTGYTFNIEQRLQ
jgi:hypothetical protein